MGKKEPKLNATQEYNTFEHKHLIKKRSWLKFWKNKFKIEGKIEDWKK